MDYGAEFVIAFAGVLSSTHSCHMHAHSGYELVYHPSGSGLTKCADGIEIVFAPGDLVIYPPDIEHDQKMKSAGIDNCVQVAVKDPEILKALSRPLLLKSVGKQSILMELEDITHWREETSIEAKNLRAVALMKSIIWELNSKSGEEHDSAFLVVSEARRIASVETAKPPKIREIARRVGVSNDYLRHLFRQYYGKSLKDFSLECRLDRARSLLANTPMSLKEISAECGFANERAFSFAFKERNSCTPGSYREKSRGKA